ncbi:MAG: FemAB family XrtA/PEP-CTERM system-associated protein [Geobacteraceae bacterium]|nr:FemAB family XrtA/PEP-CTERM system-associated protein [Geobacteraceae bacterium]
MEITIEDYEGGGLDWDAYVNACPQATNYHQYGWRNVIEKSFGHKSHYLAARGEHNEIRGLLPAIHIKSRIFGSYLISLPFFNYGGILSNDPDTARHLLSASGSILRQLKAEYAEFRHLSQMDADLACKQHKVTMILHLENDEEAQWKALDAKVRNQVRKADKSGLCAITGHLDLLDGFYEVFCRNMRDLGTPVYGKNFFRNILETFPDTTRIISVMLEGKTVASGILTWFKDTLEVPWASSISDYRDKCPNNLLYWEAIRFAIGNGSTKFDFGRSTPGEGTFRFKKQWGAEPVQLYWQYLLGDGEKMPELNTKNPKYEMAIKIWKKLPVPLTKILGPRIVKNIP